MHCWIRNLFFFPVNPKCSESDGSGVANFGNPGRRLVDDRQLFKGVLEYCSSFQVGIRQIPKPWIVLKVIRVEWMIPSVYLEVNRIWICMYICICSRDGMEES